MAQTVIHCQCGCLLWHSRTLLTPSDNDWPQQARPFKNYEHRFFWFKHTPPPSEYMCVQIFMLPEHFNYSCGVHTVDSQLFYLCNIVAISPMHHTTSMSDRVSHMYAIKTPNIPLLCAEIHKLTSLALKTDSIRTCHMAPHYAAIFSAVIESGL